MDLLFTSTVLRPGADDRSSVDDERALDPRSAAVQLEAKGAAVGIAAQLDEGQKEAADYRMSVDREDLVTWLDADRRRDLRVRHAQPVGGQDSGPDLRLDQIAGERGSDRHETPESGQ